MDIGRIRKDFPLLARQEAGRNIVYFDNAATALKPQAVADAVSRYYTLQTANIHRAKHVLSQEVSIAFEAVREKVSQFLNTTASNIIFVRGMTEGANLIADGLRLRPDDNVVGSVLEHHSNILPWKSRCEYRAAPLDEAGMPSLEAAADLIDGKTRLLAITQTSNVTGAIVPIERWSGLARHRRIPIFVDAAQSAPHMPIDVERLKCDFLAFSGHKLCGPTGVGVVYGTEQALASLDPRSLGGGAVSSVAPDFSYTLRGAPWRFESGTPDIAAVLGLGAAIDYLTTIGMSCIEERDRELRKILYEKLSEVKGLNFLGAALGGPAIPILSLTEKSGSYPPDLLSSLLSDTFGIMSRGGHHCAHPLHHHFRTSGSLRLSLHFFNTEEEIEYTQQALARILTPL